MPRRQHIVTNGTDVLITDNRMGLMTGLDLIRELRQRGITIPIVMICGDPRLEEKALAAGVTEFLDKSVPFETMINQIYRLVSDGDGRQGSRA